ncbi:mycothiol synthase [Enemella dayhoffiae]|uniref:Mycothiol acetyltransferase n=1 Tax=Enemella dayhoffiae TaxID=2016507 RepID=A0A255H535_9ACTN|nr:mycothiol synthase [Enemella dayhoffiae]OYO22820.1 mycothiol synthase [Enemella dayhoffiae]
MASAPIRTTAVAALSPEQRQRVGEIVNRASATDGVVPLNEHARLEVARGQASDGIAHLLASIDDQLVGYAFLDSTTDDPIAQLVVDPNHRTRGVATAMIGELGFDPRDPHGRWQRQSLRTWAFGDLPAARDLAATLGLRKVRELLVMERDTEELPEPQVPDGVQVRGFRPEDTDQLLRVNANAFAHHPEQGGMTRQDLQDRMNEPWFDPEGLLVATRPGPDGTEQLIGFHWTKVHDPSLGEVYVIAVDPAHAGGLGRQLLHLGLRHLAATGVRRIILYVEGDQEYVVQLYLSTRFVIANRDVVYASPLPEHAVPEGTAS